MRFRAMSATRPRDYPVRSTGNGASIAGSPKPAAGPLPGPSQRSRWVTRPLVLSPSKHSLPAWLRRALRQAQGERNRVSEFPYGELVDHTSDPPHTHFEKTLGPMHGALTRFANGMSRGLAVLLGHRRLTPRGFVASVRDLDYSSHSDDELSNALHVLGQQYREPDVDAAIPVAFAIVDEAVRRRLGTWKLFTPAGRHGPFEPHLALARGAAEAASSGHAPVPDATLDDLGLDADDAIIVNTLTAVAERSTREYWSAISLPAAFYGAVRAKDNGGELAFDPTDEQLAAGRLLFEGRVVEMSAGEGKTVAAAFPAVLHAVLGRRVHIVTANDYLASRDAEWLRPVYESLGLSVGAVLGHMNDEERRQAYGWQITYATLREVGFDFMRDNLRYSQADRVQTGFDVAIVDEADQALVDDAGTPIIIAGSPTETGRAVHRANRVVEQLVAHQRSIVAGLERRISSGITKDKMVHELAHLLVADPVSKLLAHFLASDPALGRCVQRTAESLAEDRDGGPAGGLLYAVEGESESVTLTERGRSYLERWLGPLFELDGTELEEGSVETRDRSVHDQREAANRSVQHFQTRYTHLNQVYQALRAHVLLKRDVDYVVTDGEVALVDGLTGRRRPYTRYQHGLQAAIEAKERVRVHPEPEVLAETSVPGLMGQYRRLSGMTGTALASSDELRHLYGLDAVAVPSTQPSMRVDQPARVYATRRHKLAAVVDCVRSWHRVGRPVLICTLTVEQSRELSRLLVKEGIRHSMLNAVSSAEEEEVVRRAGSLGAVTVATNMAGRGTDILLDPDLNVRVIERYVALVQESLSQRAGRVSAKCGTSAEAALLRSALREVGDLRVLTEQAGSPHTTLIASKTASAGDCTVELEFGLGLYVIGTEMNEARRIDDQLRGRCARQGAFGGSRFFLSLEDRPLLGRLDLKAEEQKTDAAGREYLEGRDTTCRLRRVQAAVEADEEADRSRLIDFSRVTERLTLARYKARAELVEAAEVHGIVDELIREAARRVVARHLPPEAIHEYARRFDRLADATWLDYGIECDGLWGQGMDALEDGVTRLLRSKVRDVRRRLREAGASGAERVLLLQTTDGASRAYVAGAQAATLGFQLCAWGHRAAVVDFMRHSLEASEQLRGDVAETFLARFVRVQPPPPETAADPGEVDLIEDIDAILA